MRKQASAQAPRATIAELITVVWLVALVAGILSNPLFSYSGRDGGIFLYIGSLILDGKIPYIDAWENKGPLVFYINALGLLLAHGSRWGIWLLEFISLLAAALMGYLAMKRTTGTIAALVGTLVWVSVAGNVLQGGNYSEEYSLLFSFTAVLAFLYSLERPEQKLFPVLIGASLGLNILLRPNLIGMQAACLGAYSALAIRSRELRLLGRRLVFMLAGGAAVIAPVALYFRSQDALQEMINVVLIFNYQYSEAPNLSGLVAGLWSASIAMGPIFIVGGMIGYALSLFSLIRPDLLPAVPRGFLLLLLVGWPLEAVLSTLSGRNYLHYYIVWAPYLGLSYAYTVHGMFRRSMDQLEKYAPLIASLLLVPALVAHNNTWSNYGAALVRLWSSPGLGMDYLDPVALYIREHTSPRDKVLVWGFRPVINFASDREAPVSYLPYPLIHVRSDLAYHWADQFYAQLTTDPPLLIINMIEPTDWERIPDLDPAVRKQRTIRWKQVVLAPNLKDVFNFVEQYYALVGDVDGHGIYRLKTSPP